MTNIQIKNIKGNILYEHACVNNTIKLTLERAVKEGANLRRADLWMANLWDANLEGANLMGANLEGAKLEGANLNEAKFWVEDLRKANLEGANLSEIGFLKGLFPRETNNRSRPTGKQCCEQQ